MQLDEITFNTDISTGMNTGMNTGTRKQPEHYLSILFCCIFFMLANTSAYAITSAASTNLSSNHNSGNVEYKKAYRYDTGNKQKRNLNKAIKWYRSAANKGHAKAQYRLGILYYKQKNYKKAKYWLRKRAKADEADAQYHYANILRFGLSGKQQTSAARKWYLKAARQGHKHAQYELALQYQKGIGAKKNPAEAKKWFQKAAKQKHKHAKQALKTFQRQKQNPTKTAQQLFLKKNLKSAKAGNSEAQYKLAMAYKSGKKAPKNPKISLKWLKKAAISNHGDAQYELASLYFEGSPLVKKNQHQARKWYQKAADNNHRQANRALDKIASETLKAQQLIRFGRLIDSALLGDAEQQYALGMHYLVGFKTEPDDEQAYYWLNLAAKQNHPRAMYQIGNQYMQGIGVKVDPSQAIHFFAAAAKHNIAAAKTAIKLFANNGYQRRVDAENGDKSAQFHIALSYLDKNSVAEKQKGLKWLLKAAEQSYPPALTSLAHLYETGELIPKNDKKAFLAYQSAADKNDAFAQYHLGRMYQTGVGTEPNQKLAYRWLEKAASQGLREAQQALQFSGL